MSGRFREVIRLAAGPVATGSNGSARAASCPNPKEGLHEFASSAPGPRGARGGQCVRDDCSGQPVLRAAVLRSLAEAPDPQLPLPDVLLQALTEVHRLQAP